MKSVILSAMMIFLGFTLTVTFSWWVQYDNIQNITETNTKRSIAYAMVKVREKGVFDANDVMRYFEEYFRMNAVKGYRYDIVLSGYIQEPLFVKMKVTAHSDDSLKGMHLEIEEAMLEEVKDEE